jgi:two-component system chemotaxis response regulator CheB
MADALSVIPGVEVVGHAINGKLALQQISSLKPDVLTLDIEMPVMDGLEVLDALQKQGGNASVIVVSALTQRGGALTMKALEKGAFDFITKPEAASAAESRDLVIKELTPLIRAIAHRREIRSILRQPAGGAQPPSVPAQAVVVSPPVITKPGVSGAAVDSITQRMQRLSSGSKPSMILIGVSTGGPNALAQVLPAIPADIGVPLFIVQHMPPLFTQSLADSLSAKCKIKVKEAADQERVEPNIAYIAPGGKQMRIHPDGDRIRVEITDDPPENNCKPSVDYLFRSVANHFPGRSLAVILTGMGSDGTAGLRLLKHNGCMTIAQDEATCVVFGMPKAAIEAGVIDSVLPLNAVTAEVVRITKGLGRA